MMLLCPKNDEESLLIHKIAAAAGIPMVVSAQPHGAKLGLEPNFLERLRSTGERAVAIVEMPGPEAEQEMRDAGFEVAIIDHHRYDGLDRMQPISSIEQFLQIFEIDDEKLAQLGFDPALVKGVGLIDRGFIWELRREVPSKDEQKRMREFYKALSVELGGERKAEMEEAQKAWAEREERDGVIIVRSNRTDLSIRDSVSFIAADHFDEAPQILVHQPDRAYLQDSDAADALFKTFGGFTFGMDRCWGVRATPPPTVDAILEVVRNH